MGLIKKLIDEIIYDHQSKIAGSNIPCMSPREIEKYRKRSKSIHPSKYDRKLVPNSTIDEVVKQGAELMKKDGFKIATEEVVKGL